MAISVGPRIRDAVGGTISSSTGYKVHTFSTPGSYTFTPGQNGNVSILVVGGGGGSSGDNSGGGGGGGSVNIVKFVPVIANTTYNLTVGAGGDFSTLIAPSSTFFHPESNKIASGGGRGGGNGNPGFSNPVGSGGGAGQNSGSGGIGAGIAGFGYDGSPSPGPSGGGGGGAGFQASGSTGGPGIYNTYSGIGSYYGGGGRGSNGSLHASSSPTNYGLGGSNTVPGNPGIIIVRYTE